MINYAKQSIDDEDISAVCAVLRSEFLTTGPKVPAFENKLKDYCGAKFCTAVTNATSALHLALLAIDVGNSDLVWTTPISFAATANAIQYVGANVKFVDICLNSFNISPELLQDELKRTPKTEMPKALIVVHLGGNPAEMEAISKICKQFGIRLIEDASHALGADYEGLKVGACIYSDITVFSFHPVKMITTGEGGALLTNSGNIDRTVKLLRSHGIDRNTLFDKRDIVERQYDQQLLGFNYRMSDIQAALGISQLTKLEKFLEERNKLASHYKKQLENTAIEFQKIANNSASSFHLFLVKLPNSTVRNKIYKELLLREIRCNFHYIPIYRLQYYQSKYGEQSHLFKNSERYYDTALTLPLYVNLQYDRVEIVINVIKKYLS